MRRLALFLSIFGAFAGLAAVAACSSTSNAGPVCVDAPSATRARPLALVDVECPPGVNECSVACTCKDGTDGNPGRAAWACVDGRCAGSAETCEYYCQGHGGVATFEFRPYERSSSSSASSTSGSSGTSSGAPSTSSGDTSSGATSSGSTSSTASPCPPGQVPAGSVSSSSGNASSSGATSSGASGSSGASSSSSGGGPALRCSQRPPSECNCAVVEAGEVPNEVGACSAGSFASGLCCAAPEWPSSGTCSCGTFRCWQRDAIGCECVIGQAVISDGEFTKSTCEAAPKTKCCQGKVGAESMNSSAVCACGFGACPSGATEVASCQATGAVCAGNTRSVSVSSCK